MSLCCSIENRLAKQHTSSFSALPVLEWCLLCECFLQMHNLLEICHLSKIMSRRRFDVLEAYLLCAGAHQK